MMLTVTRAEGWDRSRVNRLLAEALDREPLFYQTYFTALEYLRAALTHALCLIHHPAADDSLKHLDVCDVLVRNREEITIKDNEISQFPHL